MKPERDILRPIHGVASAIITTRLFGREDEVVSRHGPASPVLGWYKRSVGPGTRPDPLIGLPPDRAARVVDQPNLPHSGQAGVAPFGCPQPLPVQFKISYAQAGRLVTAELPGFPDLGQVRYSNCGTNSGG